MLIWEARRLISEPASWSAGHCRELGAGWFPQSCPLFSLQPAEKGLWSETLPTWPPTRVSPVPGERGKPPDGSFFLPLCLVLVLRATLPSSVWAGWEEGVGDPPNPALDPQLRSPWHGCKRGRRKPPAEHFSLSSPLHPEPGPGPITLPRLLAKDEAWLGDGPSSWLRWGE